MKSFLSIPDIRLAIFMANFVVKPRNIGSGIFLWAYQQTALSPGVLRRRPLVGGAVGGSPLPEPRSVSFVEKGMKLKGGEEIELPLISPVWIKAGHLSYMVWLDDIFVKIRPFIGRGGPAYSEEEVLLDKLDRTYLVGRHPSVEPGADSLMFYDPALSRTHFSLKIDSKTATLLITDLHSRKGTEVFWRGLEITSQEGWDAVERISDAIRAGIEMGLSVWRGKHGFSHKYLEPDFTLRMFANADGDLFPRHESDLFPVEFIGLNGKIISFRICRQGYTGNAALLAAAIERYNSNDL